MNYDEYEEFDHPAKPIPANMDAEMSTLGSILIDAEAIYKIVHLLMPVDFYREKHAWLYEAMLALYSRREPIDFVTLAEELGRMGRLEEIGGPAFITEVMDRIPTAIYIEHYAKIVEEKSLRRRLMAAGSKVVTLAYDESIPVDDAINAAEQSIYGVSERRIHKELVPLHASMGSVVDRIEFLNRNAGIMGIPTGFADLDRMLGGLQRSDLILLGGRPGMGKSSFGFSIAKNAAQRVGAKVAVFSLEMSNEQLVQRLLSMETGINSHALRMGALSEDEWPLLLEGANILAQTSIYIDETPGATIHDIRTKSRRLHAEHGLDVILIDYVQIMGSTGDTGRMENRQQELSYISRSLKGLARELNVAVVALCQLSRAVESRLDKRPMMSDLRESGSLEQDADVVLFIYREDYYIPDSDRQNIADILVSKHRHGETGTVSLFFRKDLTQFRDLEIKRTELDGGGASYAHATGGSKSYAKSAPQGDSYGEKY